MRTSKISQETTRVFNALSPNARTTRTTRSGGRGLATFALGYDGSVEVKHEENESPETTSKSPTLTPDIEDVAPASRSSRKRKLGKGPSGTKVISTVTKTEHESTWTSPRKRRIKKEEYEEAAEDDEDQDEHDVSPAQRAKAKPKIPARRTKSPGGTERVQPPANWEELYTIVKEMRRRNPTAPVDTMGCEDLFWQSAPPREKRYHTLTALMLSSQTKDTVTAAAMQRLHTELVAQPIDPTTGKIPQSSLTIANVLASDPRHLDSLIGKVGFHNNKTKYIKAAARMLKDQYDDDIPNTVEGLMRLPGVGPKMAYLCMSAAWGIDEGIGVDVHVHRITNLWGWHKTKTPEETRAWLESWLPRDRWHEINKMLVGLGQLTCLPVGRRCGECDLAGTGLCKSEIRGWKATERRVKREKKIEVKVDDGDDEVDVSGGEGGEGGGGEQQDRGRKVVKKEEEIEESIHIKEELAG